MTAARVGVGVRVGATDGRTATNEGLGEATAAEGAVNRLRATMANATTISATSAICPGARSSWSRVT